MPTRSEVEATLSQFVGEITQRPPIYSAIKINGQRAYKLAREGKQFEVPERLVTVYSLELLDYTYPHITVRAYVGSGTYIRSLGEDIGKTLGTGAYCSVLKRTSIDSYQLADATTIESRS